MKFVDLYTLSVAFLVAEAAGAADANALVSIENDALRISLAVQDASLTVTDKRIGLVWRQHVTPGFQVIASSVKETPGNLSAEVTGILGAGVRLRSASCPIGHTALNWRSTFPAASNTAPPPYPFPFTRRGPIGSMCRIRPAKGCSCR